MRQSLNHPGQYLGSLASRVLYALGTLVFSAASTVAATTSPANVTLPQVHKGALETDLAILDPAGRQPPTVRDFFTAASTALRADTSAAFADNPAILAACAKYGFTHLGGPMLGAIAPDGARVWVRTIKPAEVTVAVTTADGEKVFGPVRSTRESDLTAVIMVNGLKLATRHPYRVLIDGQPIKIPADAAIRTAPDPQKPGMTRIVFGADYHKIGLGNLALHEQIARRAPLAFLIYGDSAVDDRDNHINLHRSDYLLRDLSPGFSNLVASVPVYATWDDHDYFNNDLSGIPAKFTDADRSAVRKVWTQNWNNPAAGIEAEGRGIFFRTRIGPADVIMLDTRSLREGQPKKGDAAAGSFLGKEQMDWLKRQLLDCKGPFIILTSGTMWSDYVSDGKDSWGVWDPKGREDLFAFIEQNKIAGVLLVSGDRHGARGMRIPRPSGFEFHEFEVGTLGRVGGPPASGNQPDRQFFGQAMVFAFGEFEFDTGPADPTVTFRLIDDSGKTLHNLTLRRSQLTPPAAPRMP